MSPEEYMRKLQGEAANQAAAAFASQTTLTEASGVTSVTAPDTTPDYSPQDEIADLRKQLETRIELLGLRALLEQL